VPAVYGTRCVPYKPAVPIARPTTLF
jgi:hypothetical protein